MTLMEARFRIQAPLTPRQMSDLAEFSNTYGLRRFSVDETARVIRFEYDASRLRDTQVAHVLRLANIAVTERLY